MTLLRLLLALPACAPEPRVLRGGPLRFGDAVALYERAGDQHHATAALGPDGAALITWRGDAFVVVAPLDGSTPSRPFDDAPAHHPQLAAAADGFLLVASSMAGGLVARTLTPGGEPDGAVVVLGERQAMHPDLAVRDDGGLVVWASAGGVEQWFFTGAFDGGAALDPIPSSLDGVGTPIVRAAEGGFVLAWAERSADRSAIRRRALDPGGVPLGVTEEVAAWVGPDDARPALAVGGSGSALAWRRESTDEAWLQLRDAEGAIVDELALHDDGPAGRPSLAAAGDTLYVAWERRRGDTWGLALRRWDLAEARPLGEAMVVTPDVGGLGRPYVEVRATDGGVRGVVTWEGPRDGRPAVFARPFVDGVPD